MSFSKCVYILGQILFAFVNLWYPVSFVEISVDINEDVLESMLQKAKQLNKDDFAIWNIEDGVPVLFGVNKTEGVSRDDRHIILQRIREYQAEWNLSYWIPKFLPRFLYCINEQDDFIVAAYTMALDQILNENSSYHYSRESKGIMFQRDSEVLNVCLIDGNCKKFSLKTRRRTFILLEEQNVVIIRQGSPLRDYMYKDSCAVFYTIRIYVFCGNGNISERLRNAAYTLGNLVKEEIKIYNPDVGYVEIKHGVAREQLPVRQKEAISHFYTMAGFQISHFHHMIELPNCRNSHISIIKKIWEDQFLITLTKNTDDTEWFTSIKNGPLFKSMLKTDECHIIVYREKYIDDIFFLWIGSETTIGDRIRAAMKVEQTVTTFFGEYENHFQHRMTVPVIAEGREPLEVKALFIDWINEENHNYIESLKISIEI